MGCHCCKNDSVKNPPVTDHSIFIPEDAPRDFTKLIHKLPTIDLRLLESLLESEESGEAMDLSVLYKRARKISSQVCLKLIEYMENSTISKESTLELSGIFSVLQARLSSDCIETVFWSLVLLYHACTQKNAKKLSIDLSEFMVLLYSLLKLDDEHTSYWTGKFIMHLLKNYSVENTKEQIEVVFSILTQLKNAYLYHGYLRNLYDFLLISKYHQEVSELNFKKYLAFDDKSLKVEDSHKNLYVNKIKKTISKIEEAIEIKMLYKSKLGDISRHKAKFIRDISQMQIGNQIALLHDYSPAIISPNKIKKKFALVSCVATVATIEIRLALTSRADISPSSFVASYSPLQKLIKNLNSDREDLQQYTLYLVKLLYSVNNTADKESVIPHVSKFFESKHPFMQHYACSVVTGEFAYSAINFMQTYPELLKKIFLLTAEFENEKHVLKNLNFVKKLLKTHEKLVYKEAAQVIAEDYESVFAKIEGKINSEVYQKQRNSYGRIIKINE